MNRLSCLSNSIIHNALAPYRVKSVLCLNAFFVVLSSSVLPNIAAETENAEPVVPPGLTQVEKQDDYMVVSGSDGQGLSDLKGKLIIPAKFDGIRYVGDRLFAVQKYRDDASIAWWLFNDKGEVVSKMPDWTRIDYKRFQEGLLNIGDSYSPTAFIDKQGKVAMNFDMYIDVKEFSDGLAEAYYNDREGRWGGYINHQGKMVVGPFKDVELSKFEKGRARVTVYPPKGNPKSGVVTTSGKFLLPLKYERLTQFDDGLYLVSEAGKLKILDADRRVILIFPEQCTDVSMPDKLEKSAWIACGFGIAGNRRGPLGKVVAKWGYCDINGKVVMSPRFAYALSFKKNRAVAFTSNDVDNQVCGVIDRQGRWIVAPKYKYISLSDAGTWSLGPLATTVGKFSSPDVNRTAVFRDLLRVHDFIGMHLSALEKVLGKVEISPWEQKSTIGVKTVHFVLSPGGCTGSTLLQFAFDADDKVVGWRLMPGGGLSHSQSWITENVICEDEKKGLEMGNLAPKI